jgi:hypothetical protein
MKKNQKISLVVAVFVFIGPVAAFAATSPSLGTDSTFGVVSQTFTNTNTSPQTIINGGVCYTTGPATTPLSITGATVTPCDPQTGIDQSLALAILNSETCTDLGAGPIALNAVTIGANPPGTFPPGCYSTAGAMNITLGTTVTLNGAGSYIFKADGALTTGQDSQVVLTGGANASDVFWAPIAATTLGANTMPSFTTPTFIGNILDAAGITLGHFANLLGRALAFGQTVTTDSNTITAPTPATSTILHVVKLVVNANGGTAVATDFMMHVTTVSTTLDVVGSPMSGTSTPGTAYSLPAGMYLISEGPHGGYTQSFTGDCDTNGIITLAPGPDKICTIVNTDIPPPAPVAPVSSGGGGGTLVPLIGILKVPTPLALPAGPASTTYNYTVWNVGGQQPLTNVTVTDDKCSPVTYLSGDTNGNGQLDPHEIWKYSCTTTLSQTTSNTAIATGHTGGQTAIATAVATVVVGTVPGLPNTGITPAPLINILKVPSRLTPFPYGGGPVTYSYIVTNPGVVAMHNVTVTDNKCSTVVGPSAGGTNGNGLLDPGESWAYTCQTYVPVSTRDIATAEGSANGFTVWGYAFATVLVSAPGLPNTGFPPGPIQTITSNLHQGNSGADVATLQQFLISQDTGAAAQTLTNVGATAYFGNLTRAALAEFQASVGISPALGNFGPITRTYLSAN